MQCSVNFNSPPPKKKKIWYSGWLSYWMICWPGNVVIHSSTFLEGMNMYIIFLSDCKILSSMHYKTYDFTVFIF